MDARCNGILELFYDFDFDVKRSGQNTPTITNSVTKRFERLNDCQKAKPLCASL